MSPRDRRRFLRASAAAAALLAGCTGTDGGTETTDPATEQTSTATTAAETTVEPDPSAIGASAAVVSQASADSPPVAELELTNRSDRPVPVTPTGEGGLPMEYLGPLYGDGENDCRVIFFPTAPDHVSVRGGSLPDERRDGCWRFPRAEGDDYVGVVVENLGFDVTVDPGETYARRHRIYYDGADACYPASTYEATTGLVLSEGMSGGPTFTLAYSLDASDPAALALSVEKRTED